MYKRWRKSNTRNKKYANDLSTNININVLFQFIMKDLDLLRSNHFPKEGFLSLKNITLGLLVCGFVL